MPWAGFARGAAVQIALAVQTQCKIRGGRGGKRERKAPEGSVFTDGLPVPCVCTCHPSSILKKKTIILCVLCICVGTPYHAVLVKVR